ncbi:MAG: UpxY family transcription antiterminator [bacterium]
MNITEKSIDSTKLERSWYALYTRPRFEKKVDVELKLKGLESFLPLHSVVRIWSDRKKKIEAPLFPSYVFVHANLKERYLSLQTPGVVRMVSFNGGPARIPAFQIESVRRILQTDYAPQPYPYLSKGYKVEIISGPLKGSTGYIIECRGKNRLVISIDTIRQSLAIEIDSNYLKRISKSY